MGTYHIGGGVGRVGWWWGAVWGWGGGTNELFIGTSEPIREPASKSVARTLVRPQILVCHEQETYVMSSFSTGRIGNGVLLKGDCHFTLPQLFSLH